MEPRFTRSPSALTERFDDVTVVLDHRTGRSVRLNAAAGCLWDALEQPRTAGELAAGLAERFAIEAARAEADARTALAGLEARELVTRFEG